MSHVELRCSSCNGRHAADLATLACSRCSGPLEVAYEDADATRTGPPLPTHAGGPEVSLGEGGTPTVPLHAAGRLLGLDRLDASLEFVNPTGSFKDRGTAVMIAVAAEHGAKEVVEDSSGNAGASVAAYAARAGMRAHIFVPATAPEAKLRQIRAHGAEVHTISGPREKTTAAAVAFCEERGLVYASHNLSPYFLEGTKSFAYELAAGPTGVPDHIVFPVGNGSLYIGAWRGFQELRAAGAIDRVPRMHCVQPRAVMPLVAGYRGERWDPADAAPTVAGGIAVASPPRGRRVLGILRESGGAAVAVDDREALAWRRELARLEGVYAEPTSAAAFAGLERLVAEGAVRPGESVLVPVTGSGLKDETPV